MKIDFLGKICRITIRLGYRFVGEVPEEDDDEESLGFQAGRFSQTSFLLGVFADVHRRMASIFA